MIRKIIFFILSLNLILSNILFAGYTLLDKNRLIFTDGGGFEAITSSNATTGKTEKVIKALPYNNPGETYRAKGIEFIGPVNSTAEHKSIIYMINSDIFEKPSSPGTRFLVNKNGTADSISSDGIPFEVQPDTNASGAGKILDVREDFWAAQGISSLTSSAASDKFHLVIGESAKSFITFGVDTNESRIISYSSVRNGNIQAFSMTPLRLNLSNKPLYVGKQTNPGGNNLKDADVPMLSLIPAYHVDGLSRIAVNTTRVIEKITIDGNFNVNGSLVTNSEVGVVEQEVASSLPNVSAVQTITMACRSFTVKYVDHNFLFVGSMSGSSESPTDTVRKRAPTGVLWMTLDFKSSGSWIPFNYSIYPDGDSTQSPAIYNQFSIQQQSERKMQGSFDQNSFSLVSQYIQNKLPSNLGYLLKGNNTNPPNPVPIEDQTQVEYQVCLKFAAQRSGSITPFGDQNQILLLGLPAAKLDAAIPEIPPDEEADAFILEETEFTAPDRPLLEKNAVILETNEGDIAGIGAQGDFLVFTDGQDPAVLRATNVVADKTLNIDVFKILNKSINKIFSIQRNTNKALSFYIPNQDNPSSVLGPYGQIISADGTDVIKDTSSTLTEYGIVARGNLKLKSGLTIGSNQSIKLITEDTEGKLILDSVSESGYALSMPNGNVAFTGAYGGDVASMYYGKCGGHDSSSITEQTNSTVLCTTDTETLMKITFNTSKLKVSGVSTIGAKLIIMSSFSSKVQNRDGAGTYLSVELPQIHTDTTINGKACPTTTCDTNEVLFSGDPWANSAYSWSNIARLNKIKTFNSAAQNIIVSLMHTDIDFAGVTNWAEGQPQQGGDLCAGIGTGSGNVCAKSGSILVIGLYDKL
tara:strand:- start:1682 stop:4276 length:2595 start_codon:yes stop_codon:yes gene_type:complete